MKHWPLTLISALALGTFSCASVRAASPTKISFFVFAGNGYDTVPKDVIADYNRSHPDVSIDVAENSNAVVYPQMVTTRRTTPDQPLIDCGFFNVESVLKGDVDDMWESLDPKRIPGIASVVADYARPQNRGAAYETQVYGLLYNTDKVKTPPTTWAALWDPAFRGRVALFDYDLKTVALAARLNGGDERHPDVGFKVLADNAKNIAALTTSNDGMKNLLVSGDAWIAPWVNSISDVWIKQGAPLAFTVPKEGVIANEIYLEIVKGVTPAQRAVCEDLIETLMQPKNAGRAAALTSSIPLTTNVELPAAQLANPMLSPALAKHFIDLDFGYIATVTADWRARWDREIKINMR